MQRVQVPAYIKGLLQRIGRIAHRRGMGAYAVGGCVRDWLLGITQTTDLDITVEGRGPELARAVADHFSGMLTVHEQFGTATVILQSIVHPSTSLGTGSPQSIVRRKARTSNTARLLRVDFATCRKEIYARPAAYPRVAPGTPEEDLFRRDFTINAMAVVVAPGRFGALIDPFGGARDLRMRQLRILHERSFLDDPSRILRGIRFAQRFGFSWERETKRAIQMAVSAGALGWLNAGRLHKELDRMCDEPDPRACFQHLADLLNTAAR